MDFNVIKRNPMKLYLIFFLHWSKSLFNIDEASKNTGIWQPELQDLQQEFSCQICVTQLQLFQHFHERKMAFHRLQGAPRLPRTRPLSQGVWEYARIYRPTSDILGLQNFPGSSLVPVKGQGTVSGCGIAGTLKF